MNFKEYSSNLKGGLNIITIYKGYITIGLIFIIFSLIIGYVFTKKFRGHIIQNWNKYKYNPLIIPFARLLGKDPTEIFNNLSFGIFKKFYKVLMAPFTFFVRIIYKQILPIIAKSLDKFRQYTLPIRRFFKNGALMFYNKIDRYTKVVSFFFMKIRNIMKRLTATFRLLLYQLEASQLFIKSLWYGPIGRGSVRNAKLLGKASKFFKKVFPHVEEACFHENTQIYCKQHGKYRPIKEILINDIIQTDVDEYSRVIGVCKFNNPGLYDYNEVGVTGKHIVKEGQIWNYVESLTQKKFNLQPDYVYSLITENNKIFSNNIVFSDHMEISSSDYHFNSVIKLINKNYTDMGNRTLIPGLAGNNFIKTDKGQCLLDEIKIGDKLYNDNYVIGIIHFKNNDETYQLKHLIGTGRQIVLNKNEWISLQHHPFSKKINYNKNLISLITTKNIINMSGIECLDFEEVNYPLDYLSYLNKSIISN